MMHDTIFSLNEGRPVLSTVRLLDYADPHLCGDRADDVCDDPDTHMGLLGDRHMACHPLYVPFRDFRQLLEWHSGDVLMDEVTGVASSREAHSMPVQVQNFLMQLRRRDVLLRWSAPGWMRADKLIREVTQAVTDCSGFMPDAADLSRDRRGRLWRPRRLFRWQTFDAFDFDEWSSHKRDTRIPQCDQWFWRPGSRSERCFDTLAPVLALGAATDAGMCMVCGGKRTMPRCSCKAPVEVPA